MDTCEIGLLEWMNQAKEYFLKIPTEQIYVMIGMLVVNIVLFLLTRFMNWYLEPDVILLTGLSGSGKTVLYYQLRDGSFNEGTVTSKEPNVGTFILHSEKSKRGKTQRVCIVDAPGHSRLRAELDESYWFRAAGVVFVVDAVEFQQNVPAAAEYLYDILTKPMVVNAKIPVLLLFNKVDKVTAHTKDFIRRLEKEIDELRTSRPANANEYTLGIPGLAFAFAQCVNKVTVAEACGSTGNISQLEQFIRYCVKA